MTAAFLLPRAGEGLRKCDESAKSYKVIFKSRQICYNLTY